MSRLLLHLQASDVAVLQREDQQLGMPCFVAVVKGLDFGRQFATQFGGLLTGALTGTMIAPHEHTCPMLCIDKWLFCVDEWLC
jgi:hypothetical protein